MLISTNLRNWGIGSEPDTMLECAAYAEAAGIDADSVLTKIIDATDSLKQTTEKT